MKTRVETITNPDVKNLIEAISLMMNMSQKISPKIIPDNFFGENCGEWLNAELWIKHFEQVYQANGVEEERVLT